MPKTSDQNVIPKRIQTFVFRLQALAEFADGLELRLPNGAIVGALLGQIAEDVRQQAEKGSAA